MGILAAVVLGLAAGAMLAEGGLLVPWWRSLPPEEFLRWYAANAQRLVDFFSPLEIGGAVLSLIAAVVHARRRSAARAWFVLAAVLSIVVLLTFPLYFQGANETFAKATIAPADVGAALATWATWHWSRMVIGLLAFAASVAGVRAERG